MKTLSVLISTLLCAGMLLSSCGKEDTIKPEMSIELTNAAESELRRTDPKPGDEFMADPISNYPDPFNESTTIQFHIWESTKVSLVVFNENDERVALLVGQALEKGEYSVKFDAKNLPTGKYYARLLVGSNKFVEVMTKAYSTQAGDPAVE